MYDLKWMWGAIEMEIYCICALWYDNDVYILVPSHSKTIVIWFSKFQRNIRIMRPRVGCWFRQCAKKRSAARMSARDNQNYEHAEKCCIYYICKPQTSTQLKWEFIMNELYISCRQWLHILNSTVYEYCLFRKTPLFRLLPVIYAQFVTRAFVMFELVTQILLNHANGAEFYSLPSNAIA